MTLSKRGRRRLVVVSVLAFTLLIGGWWINRQLEPRRLTALVLEKAGESLGLQLAFDGEPDYAFKPEPRLLIPNLSVRGRADGKVFLSARRAEVSLPWDTITGGEPVITRIELEAPVLDLPGLFRWQDTRPPTPFKLPTLSKGLHVREGNVRDENFSVSNMALDLPRLHPNELASAVAAGVYRQGGTVVAFELKITAATPGLDSDFTIDGNGRLQQSPQALPFKLAAAGHYRWQAPLLSVDATALRLQGTSPLPNLDGKLSLRVAEKLGLDFSGTLIEWAKDWPTLPPPLAGNASRMPLTLAYLGGRDFSSPLSIELAAGDTHLQASLRIEDMRGWLRAKQGSPLPPLRATLTTPKLEIDGMVLEGVEIEIREDAPPVAKP